MLLIKNIVALSHFIIVALTMWIDTTHRSKETEIMDDLDMTGELLVDSLDKIAAINQWLGGNQVALSGLKLLLKNHPEKRELSIVDLGCGNGDILRKIAKFGRKRGLKLQLLGIDANQTTIDYAIKLSKDYPEIKYLKQDVLSKEFQHQKYDIALCTLFLHHFEDEIAFNLIQSILKNARIGLIINDLHRHSLAYYLFKLLTLFIKNKMVREDGLVSILRGFKRKDLQYFANQITFKSTIKWKWAFRYQWIIHK